MQKDQQETNTREDLGGMEQGELLCELDLLRRAKTDTEAREKNYLLEIDRLNSLVGQLVEYVETLADVAADAPDEVPEESASTPEQIKKRAVDLIIRSVRAMRKNEIE